MADAPTIMINDTGLPWQQVPLPTKFLRAWFRFGFKGGLPIPEYQFDRERRYRWDFAFPEQWLAIELDGMGWGHQSRKGRVEDNRKQNLGVELGWRVLRYDSNQFSLIRCQDTIEQVCRVLAHAAAEKNRDRQTDPAW